MGRKHNSPPHAPRIGGRHQHRCFGIIRMRPKTPARPVQCYLVPKQEFPDQLIKRCHTPALPLGRTLYHNHKKTSDGRASLGRVRNGTFTICGPLWCQPDNPVLDSKNKLGTMFSICSYISRGGHVEGFRRGSSRIGFDFAVYRDGRGLGAAYSPTVRRSGTSVTPVRGYHRRLGKSRTATEMAAFRVDSSGLRHHH
jgi:hypothetical protein